MSRAIFVAIAVMLFSSTSFADDQDSIDQCIAQWGKDSPFKKGTAAATVLGSGVRVFGIGSSGSADNDKPTDKPALIMVKPAVNVMGKSTIRLANPNGWYCFRANVTVMGKIEIEVQCTAHLGSAREDGATVGAADDTNKGVAVFGALRVTRFGCPVAKEK
jgi:hypothetical protein